MFKRIYIEISDYCNLKCSFCTSNRKNQNMLTIEQFKDILTKIKGFTKEIYFHVLGEPLIHPNIIEFINLANKDFEVCITTNGRLINIHEKLLDAKIKRMNISLNSSYDLPLTDKKEYFNNIFNFINSKKFLDNEIVFNLRYWAYDNIVNDEIIDILENRYNKKITKGINQSLSEKVVLTFDKEFVWPSLKNDFNTHMGTCLGGKTHIAILSNGDVCICCLDTNCDSKLGNIFEANLETIIKSDKFKDIIKNFNNNKLILDICKHCTYHK